MAGGYALLGMASSYVCGLFLWTTGYVGGNWTTDYVFAQRAMSVGLCLCHSMLYDYTGAEGAPRAFP